MTASVPSMTALATSLASARVGRELSIIESSIWVATMTGLALRLASLMACFWTRGTRSRGISTPRSPRATMMPSKRGDDVVDVVDGLGLLDLGDDGDPAALLVHDAVDVLDVAGAADEGEGDDVGAGAQGPAEVVDVLVGEGGDGDGDAGEVEALVVGDEAAFEDGGADVGSVDGGDLEGDAAVVDEDAFAGGDVGVESGVGGAAAGAVAST